MCPPLRTPQTDQAEVEAFSVVGCMHYISPFRLCGVSEKIEVISSVSTTDISMTLGGVGGKGGRLSSCCLIEVGQYYDPYGVMFHSPVSYLAHRCNGSFMFMGEDVGTKLVCCMLVVNTVAPKPLR